MEGYEKCQRIVCGGMLDFKFIIQFAESSFPGENVPGEEPFLIAAEEIEGITGLETQSYTISEL